MDLEEKGVGGGGTRKSGLRGNFAQEIFYERRTKMIYFKNEKEEEISMKY